MSNNITAEVINSPYLELRRRLLSGVTILTLRGIVGHVISLARLLLIITLIAPADYGLYITALGLISYVTMMSSLGIATFLLRSPTPPSTPQINTARLLLLLIGIFSLAIVAISAPFLAQWYGEASLVPLILIQTLALPIQLLRTIPAALQERSLNYRQSARIELSSDLVGFSVAWSLVWATHSVWGLLLGSLAQNIVSLLLLHHSTGCSWKLRWNFVDATQLLKFGIAASSADWAWRLHTLVNPLLVTKYLGAEAAGVVALALRVVEITGFMRGIIYRVFMSWFARINALHLPLAPALEQALITQIISVGLMLIGVVALAPWLVNILPDHRWQALLPLLPLLAIRVAISTGFNLCSAALLVLNDSRPVIIVNAIMTTTFFATTWLLLQYWPNIYSYGIATLVASSVYILIWLAILKHIPKFRILRIALILLLSMLLIIIVPTLQRGNAARDAPASRLFYRPHDQASMTLILSGNQLPSWIIIPRYLHHVNELQNETNQCVTTSVFKFYHSNTGWNAGLRVATLRFNGIRGNIYQIPI